MARQYAALAFWDAVVDAADSIVFRLMFNSLRAGYQPVIAALGPVMEAEVDNVGAIATLAEAIIAATRDAANARRRPAPTRHRGARAPARARGLLTDTAHTPTEDDHDQAQPEIEAKARERSPPTRGVRRSEPQRSRRPHHWLADVPPRPGPGLACFFSHPSPFLFGPFRSAADLPRDPARRSPGPS